jgi:hypothetical protein
MLGVGSAQFRGQRDEGGPIVEERKAPDLLRVQIEEIPHPKLDPARPETREGSPLGRRKVEAVLLGQTSSRDRGEVHTEDGVAQIV